MSTGLNPKDPTAIIVTNMLPPASATGTILKPTVVRIPINATSTSNAATNWLNPEAVPVAARAYVVFTTGGTGTFDLGVSTAGTGSNNNIIDGGTMTVGVVSRPGNLGATGTAGSAGTLGTRTEFFFIGSNGASGTNSIVMNHTNTTTSTAVGAMIVEYIPLA